VGQGVADRHQAQNEAPQEEDTENRPRPHAG
jgi:hypothetical protein